MTLALHHAEGHLEIIFAHGHGEIRLILSMIIEHGSEVHPRKNIIYQNLGSVDDENFQVSMEKGVLYKEQRMILCSDGLFDEVDDEQMSALIEQSADNEEIAKKLIDAAIDNGGNDNVSVIVISADEGAQEKPLLDPSLSRVTGDTLIPGKF